MTHDRYIIFNDSDQDLTPIKYNLPDPPPLNEIEGFNLKASERYWKHKPMPPKLRELQNDQKLIPSEKIKKLEDNQVYYAEEIKFIMEDWDRCEKGYWFFIKDKPYWITGDNYFYLQWWPIERKPPKFRMRDRKYWLFVKFTDDDEDCLGYNYPKGRREGATTRESCKRYIVASRTPNARCGLQSKDDAHAKEVHQTHILDLFKYRLPFWHIPIWDQDLQNKKEIRFYPPDGKNHPDFGRTALESIIDYRPSNATAYDGLKLRRLHDDETGKVIEVDVNERWEVQKECLVQGSKVIGKCAHTSTVEEMDNKGGKEFKKLCDGSHYEQKSEITGRTKTGLYNFFMPSYEGFGDEDGVPKHFQKKYGIKAWVDKYGFDNLDENGVPLAKQYLEGLLQSFMDAGDIEGWISQLRKYPLRWKDCWKRKAAANNFNMEIIDRRLDYYRHGNPDKQRGDFVWENAIVDSRVVWQPNKDGRWLLSYQFPDPRQSNRFFFQEGKKTPSNTTKFVAGADPFKFKSTKSGKKSNGGIGVFWKFDPSIDGTKPIEDWASNRIVCTYLARPRDKREYCEDVLKTCVYFGCKVFPEINVPDVDDYLSERGYGAYLLYRIMPNGKAEVNPGEQTTQKTIEAIFREAQHYIQHHGHREIHDEWLEDCRDIEDDMGDFDRFTAVGYAMLGARQDSFVPSELSELDINEIFPIHTY